MVPATVIGTPTPAGRILYARAQAILRQFEDLREAVHREVKPLSGTVILGMPPTMLSRFGLPLIERVWRRAGLRGVAMGRVATALDIDAWLAHTSGLFAEGGRAVLYAHDRQRYGELESVSATEQEMIDAARKARENAYAPYSGFRVGACLVTEDGRTYTGCNVESVSFTPTCCAERTALFTAVAAGEPLTPELRANMRMAATYATEACREVAQWAHLAAGTTAIREGSRFERAFRDLYTGTQHAFISEKTYLESAQVVLGLVDDHRGL